MARIKDLKKKILRVLKEYPETRDCDIELTTRLWKEYYSHKIILRQADGKYYVALDDLFTLPREDHIKRIRAKIQNEENMYLPLKISTAKKRKISMDIWHNAMAFNRY